MGGDAIQPFVVGPTWGAYHLWRMPGCVLGDFASAVGELDRGQLGGGK